MNNIWFIRKSSASEIARILLPQSTRSLVRGFVVAGVLTIAVLPTFAEEPKAPESNGEQKYFVTGVVYEKETKKPVAGAKLHVLIDSEPDLAKKLRPGVTQEDGSFRIEVPLGTCRFWYPVLKPGFWLNQADSMAAFATSLEKPVATHDFAVRTGATWPMQLSIEGEPLDFSGAVISATEVRDNASRAAFLRGEPVPLADPRNTAYTELESNGAGFITQVGDSGRLVVTFADRKQRFNSFMIELVVDPQFDMTKIKSVARDEGTDKMRMTDEAGVQATVSKATVTLRDGLPLLTFPVERAAPWPTQEYAGRIVDMDGNPIAGVRIGCAIGAKETSGLTELQTDSGADGRFAIKIPLAPWTVDGNLQLILSKDGFAAVDSRRIKIPGQAGTAIEVGSFPLQPGFSLPVRVLDVDGRPVPGAIVEPTNSYALRATILRTDSEGRGVLRNLPRGPVRLHVTAGVKAEWPNVVVSDVAADNVEVTIRMKSTDPAALRAKTKPDLVPIAAGKPAPEFSVVGWTDQQERKLSDYRGKVVVLDFWGTWCGPCVRQIPTMQELAHKYDPKDVIFLGIHTPQESFDQINKLRKLHSWEAPSAVDRGADNSDGETAQRYGVRAYPTIFIVDRDGNIALNSPEDNDEFITSMKALAASFSIEFPSDLGEPDENAIREYEKQAMAVLLVFLSAEIDKQVARPAK